MPQSEQTFALAVPPGGAINAGATESVYINVPHIMSILNRKMHHAVDRKGNVVDYAVQVEVRNMVNATTLVKTASLGYPTYRAVKAWHRARVAVYRENGYRMRDLGNGANLRPALDSVMNTMAATIASPASAGQFLPIIDDAAVIAEQAGEWDFSEMPTISAVDPADDGSITASELATKHGLFLCGDHTSESSSDQYYWSGVGMIQSWLEHLKGGWREPDAEELSQPVSPLTFAQGQTAASAVVAGEAIDLAKEGRPYQTDDDDDAEACLSHRTIQAHLETAFPVQSTSQSTVIAPCGLLLLNITNNDDSSGTPYVSLSMAELRNG